MGKQLSVLQEQRAEVPLLRSGGDLGHCYSVRQYSELQRRMAVESCELLEALVKEPAGCGEASIPNLSLHTQV